MKYMNSDVLFARPSIIEGMARLFDFGNTLNEYNPSPSEDMADETALRLDWATVGMNMRTAMSKIQEEPSIEEAE